MTPRRPGYALRLTDTLAEQTELSATLRIVLGVLTTLRTPNPSARNLADFTSSNRATILRALHEIERAELARVTRIAGRAAVLRPQGIALPGSNNHFVFANPDLVRASLESWRGRHPERALLVLSRLLRDQLRRKSIHIPLDVVDGDLGLPRGTAGRAIEGFLRAGIVERHRDVAGDEERTPVLTVPTHAYEIDLSALEPDRTRYESREQLGEHSFTLIAHDGERHAFNVRTIHALETGQASVLDEIGLRFSGQRVAARQLFAGLDLVRRGTAKSP